MKKMIICLLLVSIVGCATKPSSIQPAAVSKLPYVNISCAALEVQMNREADALEVMTGDQISQRNWDIALNILILPGVGAANGDSEDAIAQSKGRLVVMQDEYVLRCSDQE